MFTSASAPADWASCHRLLQRLEIEELLCAAHAAAEMALPVWLAAVLLPSEQQPVSQSVGYLGAWLGNENDGLQARVFGDEIYRIVRASNVPTGTPERAAAFGAAHAVFALAFHLGLCRQSGPEKVCAAVRDAVSQSSSAANWPEDFSPAWGEQWLEFTRAGIQRRRTRSGA
jgi:hypothetical protein